MNDTPTYTIPALTWGEVASVNHATKEMLRFWRKAKTPNSRQYARECIGALRKIKRRVFEV